jgi:iron complex transport system permease protein
MVPHLMRLGLGAGHRALVPACALCGGALLLWADVLARTLPPHGAELPVGVVTALLGGPFFCLILRRRSGGLA